MTERAEPKRPPATTDHAVFVKRVYAAPTPHDGTRILVDRLWPRGMAKERAKVDLWLSDIAPSAELRRWFQHEPSRWTGFVERYFTELDANEDALQPLLDALAAGPVTLLYGAKDTQYNNAVALQQYLQQRQATNPGRE